MQGVDLELLRCFVTVADLRSFTAAGIRFGRSQSAISVRIRKLEDALQGTLLTRSNQDVQVTDMGRALLPKARRLLEESERLLSEMRGPSISGRLRIGLLEYIAPHRLADIMRGMQRQLLAAELRFQIGLSLSLRSALDQGEIDLALALHDPASETAAAVATDRLVWIESAQNPKCESGGALNLCLMQAPCIYRQAALETLSRHKVAHRETVTANSVQSVRSAVQSGVGLTVLGASCLGEGLRESSHLKDLGPLPTVTLSLHGEDHRKTEVANVLRDVLAEHMA